MLTLQALIPGGNVTGQAAETKVVNAGVASEITSVASDCAPLFVAVSVYCSVSPGLALTAVAAGPPGCGPQQRPDPLSYLRFCLGATALILRGTEAPRS